MSLLTTSPQPSFLEPPVPSPKAPEQPTAPAAPEKPERLVSLDAYRGFIMLAMASSGLGLAQVAQVVPGRPRLAVPRLPDRSRPVDRLLASGT